MPGSVVKTVNITRSLLTRMCASSVFLIGLDCEVDDPCMPNLQNCPKGSLCYGPCDPNIACTSATGHAHCRGCVPGYAGVNCTEDMDECAGMKTFISPRQ